MAPWALLRGRWERHTVLKRHQNSQRYVFGVPVPRDGGSCWTERNDGGRSREACNHARSLSRARCESSSDGAASTQGGGRRVVAKDATGTARCNYGN